MSKIVVTDDFKIMTNRAIVSIKDEDKESFKNAIEYILEQLEYREYDVFIEYLFDKIISEAESKKLKQTLADIKEIAESKVKPNLVKRINGTAMYGINRIIELAEVADDRQS